MSQYHQVDIPDYVEAFYRGRGYGRRHLLAITYEFDAVAFENRFESLFRRGNQQIDVIVGVEVPKPRRESYGLWRARWPGTFHPKVIVLLGDERVAVGIGSSNMTWGGLGGNLECWRFFDDPKRDQHVLAGVRKLLLLLQDQRLVSSRVGLGEIASSLPDSPQPSVLSTLAGTLIDQVLARIPSNITALDIVSPLNCDPRKVVERLAKRTGVKKVQLYTGTKVMPFVEGCSAYWNLTPPSRVDEEENLTIYGCMHAKMFAFHTPRLVHLFWGSANLSQSAWLRSDTRANVDLLVHSRLKPKQWSQFLRALPCKHCWKLTKPVSSAALPEAERIDSCPWQLLQVVWDGQKLVLEASDSTTRRLWFRGATRGMVERTLEFPDAEAVLARKDAERLGFHQGSEQDFLEYRSTRKGTWRRVLVNGNGHRGLGLESVDAVTELFWRYTGRLLPGKRILADAASRVDDPRAEALDSEEEELTRCLYQGALDQLVLRWRLVINRILASAKGNYSLRRHRLENARRMIREEADTGRGNWTPSCLAFTERLLDEALEET